MQNQNFLILFKPLVIMLALAIALFFGSSVGYLQDSGDGQGAQGQEEPTEEQTNVICQQEMQVFSAEELKKFRDWMEIHFQNKSNTASLLADAMSRYKQLRTTLREKFFTYTPQQNALLLTEGLEGPDCKKRYVDDILKEARRLIESKATTTSAVKSTTILMDKYQEMNNKLGELTRNFLQMKAYLDTFSKKLPCYIKRSCNKG